MSKSSIHQFIERIEEQAGFRCDLIINEVAVQSAAGANGGCLRVLLSDGEVLTHRRLKAKKGVGAVG